MKFLYCGHHKYAPFLHKIYKLVLFVPVVSGVFLILSVMGMIITWWLVHDLERAQYRGQEVLRKLRSYWLPYGQVKMWLLLPVYITEGLTYSLQLGLFTEVNRTIYCLVCVCVCGGGGVWSGGWMEGWVGVRAHMCEHRSVCVCMGRSRESV